MTRFLRFLFFVAVGGVGASQVLGVTMTVPIVDNDMRPVDWAVINKHAAVSISDSRFVNTEALLCSAGGQFYSAIYRNRINDVWIPGVHGSIDTITLSADFFIGPSGVLFAPVLVQDSNVYAPPGVHPYYQQPQNANTPQGLFWSLPISLYGREVGTGPGTPDFSPGAPPIRFGIAVRRDAGGTSFLFGKVNFTITGTLIPEPATVSLGVCAATVGLESMRRRRRQANSSRAAASPPRNSAEQWQRRN